MSFNVERRVFMKRSLLTIGFSASLLLLGGCEALQQQPEHVPMSLEQVVGMAKEGKDAPTIIAQIKASQTLYDVTASQYAKLSRDGVPDAVLDFMQQGQARLIVEQGRRQGMSDAWFYGRGWGWGYGGPWYPRPYSAYVGGRRYLRNW
jgi:hypothetical protein